MTCEGSRQDYIEAVREVIEACRLTSERAEAYLARLRSERTPLLSQRDSWRHMADTISRLTSSEEIAHDFFEQDIEYHRA